jgi:hypothetical protein
MNHRSEDCSAQPDACRNPQFRRRWTAPDGISTCAGHLAARCSDTPSAARISPARAPGAGTHSTGVKESRLDFAAINAAALRDLPNLLGRWLQNGRRVGREYVARNPRRADRHAGSFKVNLQSGRWADFATDDRGGDPVSLTAFLFGLTQAEAAQRLHDMLGAR